MIPISTTASGTLRNSDLHAVKAAHLGWLTTGCSGRFAARPAAEPER